jgi:hypothetical protein
MNNRVSIEHPDALLPLRNWEKAKVQKQEARGEFDGRSERFLHRIIHVFVFEFRMG